MSTLLEPGRKTVTRLWETACAVRTIDLAPITRIRDIPIDGPQQEFVPLDTLLSDPEALRAEFAASMDELDEEYGRRGGVPSYAVADEMRLIEAAPRGREIKMTGQVWRRGFELPQYCSPSDLLGWCFLHATEPRHEDSGSVALLDPRAGSEGTAMPGLPWGREVTFRPAPGLLTVGPGWLTSTVRPVEDGQAVVVVVASAAA
ncbi:hypothetical protein M2271_007267 [Streptomyces sp. LBL]|uniref:hypothetical protein n=1 Tax=Streptomyces sp. LBL TaxID=2940562 RepID=UPI00247521D0|nr:hypothetical protein [Streptomyces sp. LBL]MDH6629431.1 hypothetical protein [Streptomyces sp. LBL]